MGVNMSIIFSLKSLPIEKYIKTWIWRHTFPLLSLASKDSAQHCQMLFICHFDLKNIALNYLL